MDDRLASRADSAATEPRLKSESSAAPSMSPDRHWQQALISSRGQSVRPSGGLRQAVLGGAGQYIFDAGLQVDPVTR